MSSRQTQDARGFRRRTHATSLAPTRRARSFRFPRRALFRHLRQRCVSSFGALALLGCADAAFDGVGTLRVIVESEDVITAGIPAGDVEHGMNDGWNAEFSEYLVVLGDIDLHRSDGSGESAEAPERIVVDLTEVPPSGAELSTLEGLAADRWDFGYQTPTATGARRHASVSVRDFEAMVDDEATYLVRGTLSQPGGRSCPPLGLAEPPPTAVSAGQNDAGDACYENPVIGFELSAPAPTRYGPCEIDGLPGVTLVADSVQTVAITIHGDHLFFNGFPEGAEARVVRLAQWLADADLDLDGSVDRQELEAIELSRLSEIDARYQLGGSPVTPLETAWDYVVAQLKTQGHYQGEGECPIDGSAHAH